MRHPRPGRDPREAYRLRYGRPLGDGTREMIPIPGDDRLFPTWRDAFGAGLKAGGPAANVYTQAVILGDDGTVVFPPDDRPTRCRGLWPGARRKSGPADAADDADPDGAAEAGDEAKPAEEKKPATAGPQERPAPPTGRWAHERPKNNLLGLDPDTARRIAEIRKTSPRFGMVDEQTLPPGPGSR